MLNIIYHGAIGWLCDVVSRLEEARRPLVLHAPHSHCEAKWLRIDVIEKGFT
jgi:hypothetical protein